MLYTIVYCIEKSLPVERAALEYYGCSKHRKETISMKLSDRPEGRGVRSPIYIKVYSVPAPGLFVQTRAACHLSQEVYRDYSTKIPKEDQCDI